MPVFKATLRSVRAYITTIIIYFVVFAVFGTMTSRMNAGISDTRYQDVQLEVAVIDNDHSDLSEALTNYIDKTQKLVDNKTEDPQELNDNVRFDIYDYVLVIPEGFSESITADNLEYYSSSDSASGYLMTEKIRTYITDIVVYLGSGYSMDEAISLTDAQTLENETTDVSILNETGTKQSSYLSGMYTFLAYSLLMMLSICIGSVLTYHAENDIRNRIAVSGMSFRSRYIGLISAVLVIGFILTISMTVFTVLTGMEDPTINKIGYYILNEFALMFVGIGIAYFISSISHNTNIINMLSNMLTLSMAFLCGVFVPSELLDKTIVAASHFMPLYWYVQATTYINDHALGQIFSSDFISYLLIQLLFAVIFFVGGLVISRKKEQYAI